MFFQKYLIPEEYEHYLAEEGLDPPLQWQPSLRCKDARYMDFFRNIPQKRFIYNLNNVHIFPLERRKILFTFLFFRDKMYSVKIGTSAEIPAFLLYFLVS